jgi:hypothetical protein
MNYTGNHANAMPMRLTVPEQWEALLRWDAG